MKPLVVLCLALGALPAFGEETGQAPVAPPIALFTKFQQEPPAAVTDALHGELSSIMQAAGISFTWRSVDHNAGEVVIDLAVITFKGRCNTVELLPIRTNPGALGWTHMSDGTVIPFSDVDCDRIRAFVQHDLLEVDRKHRDAVFGRAVARVLAHELYHIFAHTQKHGSEGIAKPAYTVQDLLSDTFTLEPQESNALRSSRAVGANTATP